MSSVAVIGAGFAGCSAAIAAAKAGAEVVLLEKSNNLAGLGLMTGVLGGGGVFTCQEEMRALGGYDIFQACESVTLHNIAHIPELGRRHINFFSVLKIGEAMNKGLQDAGVDVKLQTRVKGVHMKDNTLTRLVLEDGTSLDAHSFVDATGSSSSDDGRVSISSQAGVRDLTALGPDGKPGGYSSTSFMLIKDSLPPQLMEELERKGYLFVDLPKGLIKQETAGTGNAQPKFIETLYIVDTGFAKVSVKSFIPMNELRRVPGFENARMADPIYSPGDKVVRGMAMAPRENSLRVEGLANLYCAGEKSGPISGIAGVITTGVLAGHNAARNSFGKEDLVLPRTLSVGDFIAYGREMMSSPEGLQSKYSFAGGAFFNRIKELGLHCSDSGEIQRRVEKEGLSDIFARKLA